MPRLRGGIKVAETEGPLRYSSKRARAYKRGFDHDLARQMLANGMTARQVADHFGVSKSAVYKMKQAKTGTEQVVFPVINTCPRCFRRKGKGSKLCKKCFAETKLQPLRAIYHPPRTMPLGEVEEGRVVSFRGRYGVTLIDRPESSKRRLSCWEGSDEIVDKKEEVVVLEYTEWTA